MQRFKLAAALLLMFLSAAEFASHHHPLGQENGAPSLTCVVCAFSADSASSETPTMAVRLPVAWLVATAIDATPVAPIIGSAPARAPPAAS